MPIPEQRDLDKARGVIRDWLAGKLPDARDLTISALVGPAFTGFSNETVMFDATWADAEVFKTACGKGFPKPKEVFGTLAKGDAYVPDGFEKKGRVTIDLATRKVLPPN